MGSLWIVFVSSFPTCLTLGSSLGFPPVLDGFAGLSSVAEMGWRLLAVLASSSLAVVFRVLV